MSNLQKRLQMSRLPPMPPSNIRDITGSGMKRSIAGRRDYTPVTWDNYFHCMKDIATDDGSSFRVYFSGSEGPVCFFIHGAGFSALSWANLTKRLTECVKCQCAAIDMRGHGDTETTDDGLLSAEQLSQDINQVVQKIYGDNPPPIFLIGHSMGGAIAVHVASKQMLPSLLGLAVIDVVEGTALEALKNMHTVLKSRPKQFRDLQTAIEWSVRSGHIRNIESAKVSMVGQLKRCDTNESATHELETNSSTELAAPASDTIKEEDEEAGEPESEEKPTLDQSSQFKTPQQPSQQQLQSQQYTWRIDLAKTEPYWKGWFQGLSQKFLSCNVPKLLLLAGVDRLDKDLTVGQMQGKFQMQVLPQSGHAVQEDVPDKVADLMATFLVRQRVAEPTGVFQPTFPAC